MNLPKPSSAVENVRVEIDNPLDRCLRKPAGSIIGWFAAHTHDMPEEVEFRIGPIRLPHKIIPRPDVEGAMQGYCVVGFEIRYELSNYLPYIDDLKLVIRLIAPEYYPISLRLKIQESALAQCLDSAGGV
jgi:hypothetical protein